MAPTAFADLRTIDDETQATIQLAEGFYEDVLDYRNQNNFSKYIGNTYIQHAPAYGDGPAAMIAAVAQELTADPGVDVALYRTIADGPYAAIHSVWTASAEEQYVYVDIFRFDAQGKIVEHWDIAEEQTGESANSNDPFHYPQLQLLSLPGGRFGPPGIRPRPVGLPGLWRDEEPPNLR